MPLRKLSRPTEHRMLMLRNMVTSLFEHEQIKTTLPKARECARLAEKMITVGKKGDANAMKKASAFILKKDIIPKLFTDLASRYATRRGGYTRIHKFGNRQGDNAPMAVLELVDNPRDLRWEMTARTVGWELVKEKLKNMTPNSLVKRGVKNTQDLIASERNLGTRPAGGLLRTQTRRNLQKVLRFRPEGATLELTQKVNNYVDALLASNQIKEHLHPQPGQSFAGETRSALSLSRGILGHLGKSSQVSSRSTLRPRSR